MTSQCTPTCGFASRGGTENSAAFASWIRDEMRRCTHLLTRMSSAPYSLMCFSTMLSRKSCVRRSPGTRRHFLPASSTSFFVFWALLRPFPRQPPSLPSRDF